MNPSNSSRPAPPGGLKDLRLPRISVAREQSVPGKKGAGIDAFGVDSLAKLIEAFETRERELKGP